MGSLIDDLIAQQERDSVVIRFAQADDLSWWRGQAESEAAFLARVREEAYAAGHRTVTIRGWIKV
jgi:hypothetical protein